jgi:hypothetical protein
MDEMSWRARLAKSNINILNIDDERWYYEFMYHPKYGQTKWCKTYYKVPKNVDVPEADPVQWIKTAPNEEDIASYIQSEVLKLRKELED